MVRFLKTGRSAEQSAADAGKVRDTVRKSTQGRQDPYVYGSLGSEQLFFKSAQAAR